MNREETIKNYKDQAQTWLNRAYVAHKMNNAELSKQAMEQRWQFLQKLAELEGTPPPDKPQDPEEAFENMPADSDQS
jgi:hypothetical protein